MAIGTVITVISSIPWGEVVEAAPKLAVTAGHLWDAANRLRKRRLPPPAGPVPDSPTAAQPSAAERLDARVSEVEEGVGQMAEQLEAQARAIGEVIEQQGRLVEELKARFDQQARLEATVSDLASQCTRLSERVEAERRRADRLMAGGVVGFSLLGLVIACLLLLR